MRTLLATLVLVLALNAHAFKIASIQRSVVTISDPSVDIGDSRLVMGLNFAYSYYLRKDYTDDVLDNTCKIIGQILAEDGYQISGFNKHAAGFLSTSKNLWHSPFSSVHKRMVYAVGPDIEELKSTSIVNRITSIGCKGRILSAPMKEVESEEVNQDDQSTDDMGWDY